MAGLVGDINKNLIGLQQLALGRQEIEQRNKVVEDDKIASDALRNFYASAQSGKPDYSLMNEAVLRSPDLAKNVLSHIGIQEKRQGQDAADFVARAASSIENPEAFLQLAKNRIDYLQANGRDPKDTIALAEMVQRGDFGGAKKDLQAVGAALANQGYLDKDIYAQAFGAEAPLTALQRAQLAHDSERIGLQREGLDIQRQGLEIDKLKAGQGLRPKPLDANDIKGIQKDVSGLLQDTQGIYNAAKTLDALMQSGSPASQHAAVINFVKALDPGSTVRETESGQIYSTGGLAQGLLAKYNAAVGQGGLPKEVFKDIVDTSKSLANSAIDSSEQQLNDYLNPYADTIPENFKQSISRRVPKRFDSVKSERPPLDSFQR